MKRFIFAIAALLLATCAHATSVWNLDLEAARDDQYFSLVGQFTTEGDLVTSFTGTFSDVFEGDQAVTLVPLGQTVVAGYGSTFLYDNLFFGPDDLSTAFDNNGLLLQAGISTLNIYSDDGLIGYDFHDYFFNIVDLTGTITLDHTVSAVPEPTVPAMLAFGALAIGIRRKTSSRNH